MSPRRCSPRRKSRSSWRSWRGWKREGKSILFISHKLNEIMAVSDRVISRGKAMCIGTVNTCDTTQEELSRMMVNALQQTWWWKRNWLSPGKRSSGWKSCACPPNCTTMTRCITYPSACAKEKSFALPALMEMDKRTWCMPLRGWKKSTGRVTLCGHDITHATIHERTIPG